MTDNASINRLCDALIDALATRNLLPEDIRKAMDLAFQAGLIQGGINMADKVLNAKEAA